MDWTAVVLFVLLLACVAAGALLPPRPWSAALLWGASAVLLVGIVLTVAIPDALPPPLFAFVAAVLGTRLTIKDLRGNGQILPTWDLFQLGAGPCTVTSP